MGEIDPSIYGIKPEEKKSTGDESKVEQQPEVLELPRVELITNTAKQELGFMQRVQGKARKIMQAMALVTMVSAPQVLWAEQPKEAGAEQEPEYIAELFNNPEQVEQQEDEVINEHNLTESSLWARELVKATKEGAENVTTQQEAQKLIKSNIKKLTLEFLFPTVGKFKPDSIIREYSEDDLFLMIKSFEDFKTIMAELNDRFELRDYGGMSEGLDRMVRKVENRFSPDAKAEQQRMQAIFEESDKMKQDVAESSDQISQSEKDTRVLEHYRKINEISQWKVSAENKEQAQIARKKLMQLRANRVQSYVNNNR